MRTVVARIVIGADVASTWLSSLFRGDDSEPEPQPNQDPGMPIAQAFQAMVAQASGEVDQSQVDDSSTPDPDLDHSAPPRRAAAAAAESETDPTEPHLARATSADLPPDASADTQSPDHDPSADPEVANVAEESAAEVEKTDDSAYLPEGGLPRQDESHNEGNDSVSALDQPIQDLLAIDGASGAAIVDIASGMALATGGNPGFDLDVAAAGNSNVVRAKLKTMSDLGVQGNIEDILITLDSQYHLINVLNGDANKGLFIYLVLNRANANLALARHKLNVVARNVRL